MILDNQLSIKDLNFLEMWLTKKPYIEKFTPAGELFYKRKELDYHLDNSIPTQILKPIIDSIIPNASIETEGYVESYTPFGLHVDTVKESINAEYYTFNPKSDKSYNTAVLIPLDEGDFLRTVIFDVKCDEWIHGMSSKFVTNIDNGLDENEFSHVHPLDFSNIKFLPLLEDNKWKRGSIIYWDRKYLHLASDYRKHCKFKRAITLFFH